MYIAQTLIRTGFGLSNNLLRYIFKKKDKHLWQSAYQYGSKRLVQSSVTSAKVIKFNRLKLVKIRT